MLTQVRRLAGRARNTIFAPPYVGPGIEVLSIGRPIGAVITDLFNIGEKTRETILSSRPAPGDSIVSYKWNWLVGPSHGTYLKFDNSAYTVLVVEPFADLGNYKLQVVGTRADGSQVVSKEIGVVVIRGSYTQEGA